jgi:hypothetical protein
MASKFQLSFGLVTEKWNCSRGSIQAQRTASSSAGTLKSSDLTSNQVGLTPLRLGIIDYDRMLFVGPLRSEVGRSEKRQKRYQLLRRDW